MANKKGLGRGLDALLESFEPGKGPATLQEVSVYDIDTNPDQPRKTFDEEKLNELATSIRTHGIVQPLILYRQGNRYTIVAGERRYRAARLAGLKAVPAVITDKEEHELQEVSLIENLQREDLNPVEEAAAIRFLMIQHNLTQEEVSSRIGRSRPAVTNALRLLNLPESVQGIPEMITDQLGIGLPDIRDPQTVHKTEQLGLPRFFYGLYQVLIGFGAKSLHPDDFILITVQAVDIIQFFDKAPVCHLGQGSLG